MELACEMCRRPLQPTGRGRPPRYCSRACQARAYRTRVADRPVEPTPGLSLERIVRAAVTVADREGIDGLSMRRTAAELDAGVMSLYRYVPGKEELVDVVVDALFGEHPLPEPGPPGWRAKLELSARSEWSIYRDHPWLVPVVATTSRPPIALNMMAYTDWRMRAVDGLGLDFPAMVQVAISISAQVAGAALALAGESRAYPDSRQEWLDSRQWALRTAFESGRLPMVSRFGEEAYRVSAPEAVFEFGLQRALDGIAALLPGMS